MKENAYMTTGLYVVWDEVAKQTGKIFEAPNDGIAWRIFEQSNKDNSYANESHLMVVGTADKITGRITAGEPTEITAADILHHEEDQA